jgi:hypothetical protein
VPTVVLGGSVLDATEAVFLLRRTLLRFGSLYCFNYPRRGLSHELLFAHLDDLVDELSLRHGRQPRPARFIAFSLLRLPAVHRGIPSPVKIG